jgi:hypothetical protein
MEPLDPIFLERLGERYKHAVAELTPNHPRPIPSIDRVPDVEPNERRGRSEGFFSIFLRIVGRILRINEDNPAPPLPPLVTRAMQEPPPIPPEIQALINQVRELQVALAQVQTKLAAYSQAEEVKQNALHMVASDVTGECERWIELLHTHVKVVRVLEDKDAKMGIYLPAFEKIELEERRVRVGELQKSLQENCQEQ